ATRFSVGAMELFHRKKFNHMIAIQGTEMVGVPVEKVMNRQRTVPLDSHLIKSALCVGTSFGSNSVK
ncbi:MAG TPA: 6-phosphofructokinase, partial [Calditrichia bacterium]|nr:6-phosphofructokinase [Calditrichia bacterium]